MELKHVIAKIADMPLPVLITGETGAGKEVFAEALHLASNHRHKHNFVKINCAAIPGELLEKEGKFREDLYYRINVLELYIPPLRERKEDIAELSKVFIRQLNEEYSLEITGMDGSVMKVFQSYHWPGNVRELRHVIERACMMRGNGTLIGEDVSFYKPQLSAMAGTVLPDGKTYESDEPMELNLRKIRMEAEKKAIRLAIDLSGGNKAKAAKLLGIERTVLYDKLRKYDMDA